MSLSNPLISIIIPVFNAENFISTCLESILYQDFKDYEIILINDGSTDKSGEICERYKEKDGRITVIHKSNEGVSIARNSGIKLAKGEWILFCDSDDQLSSNCLNVFYKASKFDFDLISTSYSIIKTKEIIEFDTHPNIFSSLDYAKLLLTNYKGEYQGYLWCKLFRRNIIINNTLEFDPNISYNEDRLFIFQYLTMLSNQIIYLNEITYFYNQLNSGAMNSIQSNRGYKKFQTDLIAFIKIKKIIKSWYHKDLNKLINDRIYSSWRGNISLICKFSTKPVKESLFMTSHLIKGIGLVSFISLVIQHIFKLTHRHLKECFK